MREKVLGIVLALVISLVFPSLASAETINNNQTTSGSTKTPMTLVHAFNPSPVTSEGSVNSVRARVNNWTSSHQTKLVCVEAQKVGGGNNHLGCLDVHLMPKMSMEGDWAREFDTPIVSLGTGSYRLMYTYQDDKGMWFPVTSLDGSSVNTTFSK